MPPQNRHHGALPPDSSIHRAMTPPWPSIQGVMYGQQPSYPTMQNSLQPSAGVPFPPLLPQRAFPQPSSASTSAINQSHTLGNSAFDMQQAVVAPPFILNPPVLPDSASAFDDDYIHPRTGRPTRPFLPHDKVCFDNTTVCGIPCFPMPLTAKFKCGTFVSVARADRMGKICHR